MTAKNDPVRPGEQWFCYWKTSAALWENHIQQIPHHEIIFLPIYWGFHLDERGFWDFGKIHPEKDLYRLSEVLTRNNRSFCWILPLTPAPFLPNGGIPSQAARTLSVTRSGLNLGVLDSENSLNKIYSFFDPKVFQTFSDFINSLSDFLKLNKIRTSIWGAVFNYQEGPRNFSYLQDSSLAFEQGFSRFLKQNASEQIELTHPREEEFLKQKFSYEVQNLFNSCAETGLANYWSGIQKISVLGGSPVDTIERCFNLGRSQLNLLGDLARHHLYDRWISSALLSLDEKGSLLPIVLKEHFGANEVENRFQYRSLSEELSDQWKSLELVSIFDYEELPFLGQGLMEFLENHLKWAFQVHEDVSFNPDWIDENQGKIKFFRGEKLSKTKFNQILKLFLMGQTIVLDQTGLEEALVNRLEVFFVENNLKTQKVNFITALTLCELGEGRLIVYDGSKLNKSTSKDFWHHFFGYFKLKQLESNIPQDVFGFWRIRSANHHELSFIDIRRINLYNPTSYKKTVSIQTKNCFAFMKVIDPHLANAKSLSHSVEVELLPNGKIALDFGHYEERL
jgi:hypothetical protein